MRQQFKNIRYAPSTASHCAPRSRPRCWPHIFTTFSLCIALLTAGSVDAQSTNSVKILEHGIYRAETVEQKAAPGTTGIINSVRNPLLVSSTNSVTGQVGVRFGLRYLLVGTEPGPEKVLRLAIIFPPAGLRDPQTGQVHYQNEQQEVVPAGIPLYWEYQFEHAWEIVEGIWQFEFWDGAKKLGQQRFCVRRLENLPPTAGLSAECRQDSM